MPKKNILVFAQTTRENKIHNVFFELVSKARELCAKVDDFEINAVILGNNGLTDSLKSDFYNWGLSNVYCIESPDLNYYSSINYSRLIVNLVNKINPEIVLIGATNLGRDLAPRIACSLHTGLTADCVDLDINEDGKLLATRPTFGGQLMATIMCKKNPQMATVRPNVFKSERLENSFEPNFIYENIDIDLSDISVEVIDYEKKQNCENGNFEGAKIIVAGGKGLKNKEGFELLDKFAKSIGACTGATRGAVEKGLAPVENQIGQTGKTVNPDIYIACGISGAIQHTVGMENSDYIIAINNDENAPIFDIADMGIVGDAIEILSELTKTKD